MFGYKGTPILFCNRNMDAVIKNQIVNSYLTQQLGESSMSSDVATIEVPTQAELDEFKAHVRSWMEVDNAVKKLQAAIKERNSAKNIIAQRILSFMCKFNIEDLNTKEGKLKYRVSQVRAPISQSTIKARLIENYDQVVDSKMSIDDLTKKIFDNDRAVKEKHSLRRGK